MNHRSAVPPKNSYDRRTSVGRGAGSTPMYSPFEMSPPMQPHRKHAPPPPIRTAAFLSAPGLISQAPQPNARAQKRQAATVASFVLGDPTGCSDRAAREYEGRLRLRPRYFVLSEDVPCESIKGLKEESIVSPATVRI